MDSFLSKLELKLPPLLVALLCSGLIYLSGFLPPIITLPDAARMALSTVLVLCGALFGIGAIRAFRRARTTVNPMTPDKASAVVTNGVFRFSRNPMYLALLLFLLAFAVYRLNLFGVFAALLFIPYMNRFQIAPEERAMKRGFGEPYQRYCRQVRRWL